MSSSVQDALAREEQLEEHRPEECCSRDAADDSQKKNQRSDEYTEVMQEITRSAEPAEERSDRESVDADSPTLEVSPVRSMAMCKVADVDSSDVQVGEASDDRDDAEDETDGETDEIEGVHIIWCSVWRLVSRAGWAELPRRRRRRSTQNVEEAVEKCGRLDDGLDEKEATA